MESSSVTTWIARIKQGDDDAARELWERYHERLLKLARRLLGFAARREADESDLVQDAFKNFFAAARAGKFARLKDRDDFWRLITVMASNRARDYQRRQRRGQGKARVLGESALPAAGRAGEAAGIEQMTDSRAASQMLEVVVGELCELFEQLGEPQVAQIVALRVEGWKHKDIASKLDIAPATVERKLRSMKRRLSRELAE
ncbi:MAG TPA: sigma-70 family RNA polymerase sigma factor [Pirellulales bacterium]|nr:sigma-70 family RNA polymerase sigma factor [Pirellulales bacterium]